MATFFGDLFGGTSLEGLLMDIAFVYLLLKHRVPPRG